MMHNQPCWNFFFALSKVYTYILFFSFVFYAQYFKFFSKSFEFSESFSFAAAIYLIVSSLLRFKKLTSLSSLRSSQRDIHISIRRNGLQLFDSQLVFANSFANQHEGTFINFGLFAGLPNLLLEFSKLCYCTDYLYNDGIVFLHRFISKVK